MMHPATRTVLGGTGKMVTDLEGHGDEVKIHAGLDGGGDGSDADELLAAPKAAKAAGSKGVKSKKGAKTEGGGSGSEASASARPGDGDDGDDDVEAAQPSRPRVLGVGKKDAASRAAGGRRRRWRLSLASPLSRQARCCVRRARLPCHG
eukprot:359285-Chlamydomonas_euryale.AAC.7